MAKVTSKPKRRHRAFVPGDYAAQRNGAFAFAIIVCVAIGVALWLGGPIEIVLIWGIPMTLAVFGGLWASRSNKTQVLVENALAAPHPQQLLAPRPSAAEPPVPLEVEILKARKLDKPRTKYRRVTADANVVGRPPVRILHLWVFENHIRLSNYFEGGWREFGSVHLLRQAGSISRSQFNDAHGSGRLGDLFAENEAEVAAAIAAFDYEPDVKRSKRLKGYGPASTRVFDRYGGYPLNSLLCHSQAWTHALRELLRHVDLVTVDLSGYTSENEGSAYEMRVLMDTFPLARVIWLTDPWSDCDYLVRQLQECWQGLAPGSPNRLSVSPRARLVITDRVRHSSSSDGKSSDDELVADRNDARRILANLV